MELTLPQTQLHPKYLPFLSLKSSRVSVFHRIITPNPTCARFQASIFSRNLTPLNPPRNISTAALVDGNGNNTSTFPIDSGFSSFSSLPPLLRFSIFQ